MIRTVFFSAGIIVLFVNACMAQEQGRPAWARFAKNETRLGPQAFASALPAATAFVAADGTIKAFPADVAGHGTGSTGEATICSSASELRPAELRKVAESIAADEGVAADLVVAILRIERRAGAEAYGAARGLARLAFGSRTGNHDCQPAVTLHAGIRRLKELSSRFPDRMHLLGAYHAGEDVILNSGGVPSSPETLRFVAEVMNDLAGGIAPQATRRPAPTARRIAGAEPAPRPSVPSFPSRATGDPRWASGFVLNLE